MRMKLSEEQIDFLNQLPLLYGDMLTKYAYRFFGYQQSMYQAAEDAVQDTFIRALYHVDALMSHPNVAGWLVTGLRYTLLNYRRSQPREELFADPAESAQVSAQMALESLERWERSEQLSDVKNAVLSILTVDELVTFNDYFLMGFSTEETALVEQVSFDTVRGRLQRIRKKLQKKLTKVCCFLLGTFN